jgi:nitrogen fixation NifU-like protein
MDLKDLYQDIILDHGQHPRNFGKVEPCNHQAHGHNPLCGDTVTVYLDIEGDRVAKIGFEGRGCAISQASASLMTEVVQGKTTEEARALFGDFQARTTGRASVAPAGLEEDAERLEPLTGVKAYPMRVKCAVLAWHTLIAALEGKEKAS